MKNKFLLLILVFTGLFSCKKTSTPKLQLSPFVELKIPTTKHCMFPNLHSNAHELYLTWLAEPDSLSQLMFSKYNTTKTTWSSPVLVASGTDWFVNWADFPSMASTDMNNLTTYFLPKSGKETYAYDVALTQSVDGGNTWKKAIIPHHDKTETEHGFVSFFPIKSDKTGVVWLDGRNAANTEKHANHDAHDHGAEADMTLRFASIDKSGKIAEDALLDERVCSCCQTDAATFDEGAIVVYRDRSAEEIRDVAYVLYQNKQWSAPKILHQDNWKMPACPVNGPAVDAIGQTIAAAWYTIAEGEPKVKLAFSINSGQNFEDPILLDNADPLGRVDIKLLDENTAAITWIAQTEKSAILKLQLVNLAGEIVQDIAISAYNASRASGFPRMEVVGRQLFIAWTAIDEAGTPFIRLFASSNY